MAEHIETKFDEVSGRSKPGIAKEIKREMEEVAKAMDIAFTTEFWTSLTGESFMTMSMHWIT